MRRQRQERAGRDEQHDRPGQERGGDLARGARGLRVRAGPVRGTRQYRHHDGGQRPAEHDVVDDVRHLVGGHVRRAEARVAHRVREHELAPEPDDPCHRGERSDEDRGAADAPGHLARVARLRVLLGHRGGGPGHRVSVPARAGTSPSGASLADWAAPGWAAPGWAAPGWAAPGWAAGRRPSMSSHRSAGVCSITPVKLTTSLAAVSPMTAARTATLAGRGRAAAAAAPSMAPSALAPASPSIARSPRSSGSTASAAPTGGAAASLPAGEAAPSTVPAARVTLMARPGRRSNRFSRFAPPATRPALTR